MKVKIKITKARRKRLTEPKVWLKDYQDIPFYELKTLYRRKYNLNNVGAYRDLACLGYQDAITKVENINKSNEEGKLKKLKMKQESDMEIWEEYDGPPFEPYYINYSNNDEDDFSEVDDDLPF